MISRKNYLFFFDIHMLAGVKDVSITFISWFIDTKEVSGMLQKACRTLRFLFSDNGHEKKSIGNESVRGVSVSNKC